MNHGHTRLTEAGVTTQLSDRAKESAPQAEIARIRLAYAQRTIDLSDTKYRPTRPDVIMNIASVRVTWGRLIDRYDLRLGRVLEVGCGSGSNLRWLHEIGATHAIGVDVLGDRLSAGQDLNPAISYLEADGRLLPFQDGSFDTVVCSTLFSSILADEHQAVLAREISRVLRRPGHLLWFDFFRNNPANGDVRAVPKERIASLFDCSPTLSRVLLAPPLSRRTLVMNHLWLRALLEFMPLLKTHYAGLLCLE